MGIAMGLTAIAIIYSPWGKQSGAHINPVVTLTFYPLASGAIFSLASTEFHEMSSCGYLVPAVRRELRHSALVGPDVIIGAWP